MSLNTERLELGQLLKAYREKRGMSQKDVSRAVEEYGVTCHHTTLSHIERRKPEDPDKTQPLIPGRELLLVIGQVLHIPTDDLLPYLDSIPASTYARLQNELLRYQKRYGPLP